MRGVKTDPELMSSVISEGINNGCVSMSDIVSYAKDKIKELDQKIIEAEKLKVTRSKLSTVVSSLESNINNRDERLISLFEIKDFNKGEILCKKINQIMIDNGSSYVIDPIRYVTTNDNVNRFDWIYCLKDLYKHKVLINDNGRIYKGENFVDFLFYCGKQQ